MKIAIIGNAGSGKSTLALRLYNITGIPLYHLDQYFWKPNWQEPEPQEFEKIHNQLCDKEKWIIEGVATRLFEYRIQKADIVIFLDIPTYLCLFRVFKRVLTCYGKVYFSSAKECPERGPSRKFLKFILNFNRERKSKITSLLKRYKNQKRIYVVKTNLDVTKLLERAALGIL